MALYFYPSIPKLENRTNKESGIESYLVPDTLKDERADWLEVITKQREWKTPRYQVDGDGNPILDADGNPIPEVDGDGNPVFDITIEDYKVVEVNETTKTSVLADRAAKQAANQAAKDARDAAIAGLKAKGHADLTSINDLRNAIIQLRDLLL